MNCNIFFYIAELFLIIFFIQHNANFSTLLTIMVLLVEQNFPQDFCNMIQATETQAKTLPALQHFIHTKTNITPQPNTQHKD